ncbi:MAG: CbtA family protein [Devosia sp.]
MARTFLIRGLLCGLVAGLCIFVFAHLVGEPGVDAAIGFEEAGAHASHHMAGMTDAAAPAEVELVSRDLQSGWGLFTGVMIYATALGGMFSLLFAFAWGRMGRLGARASSALLAGAAFVAVYAVPFLKYPANPPSVGNADTIQFRTVIYFGMVLTSIVAMIAAINLGRRLKARLGGWNAALAGGVAFVVIVALAAAVLPSLNEVPEAFPASLLWSFRLTSFGIQLLLWSVLGLLFGELTERSIRRSSVAPFAAQSVR